jgi:hypothetical protein
MPHQAQPQLVACTCAGACQRSSSGAQPTRPTQLPCGPLRARSAVRACCQVTETAAYKKGQELVEDLKDKYETSDNPMVHKVEVRAPNVYASSTWADPA